MTKRKANDVERERLKKLWGWTDEQIDNLTPKHWNLIDRGSRFDEYRLVAEVIDANEIVITRRISVAASYKLIDSQTGEALAGPKTARWSELYRLRTGRSLTDVRADALRKLAQKIVQDVFQPWPEQNGQGKPNQPVDAKQRRPAAGAVGQ